MKKNTTPPGGIFFCGLEKPCKDQKNNTAPRRAVFYFRCIGWLLRQYNRIDDMDHPIGGVYIGSSDRALVAFSVCNDN